MKTSMPLRLLLAVLALGGLTTTSLAATQAPGKRAAHAAVPSQALSAGQLSAAELVLTGKASCEFNQVIDVAAVKGKAGHFSVAYKGKTYTMVPETTNTGAVRLEDKKAGMMWLQIADKSMLMNTKAQKRLVDNCRHPLQKV
ncbi:MAG: hypothetical protein WA210_00095 [Burkholderiaceae bacterium]